MTSGASVEFGPYQLQLQRRQLLREGVPIPLSDRQFDLLHALVSRPGEVLPRDALIQAAWRDVAVGDNSLDKIVSQLRRLLDAADPGRYIATVPRVGYRFSAPVARIDVRRSDEALDALLAPHRALVDGRAALETLERGAVARARITFERLVGEYPNEAAVHVGLANACVLQFESTRANQAPDVGTLRLAAAHARDACRLDPDYGEAWATLGFVLERTGEHTDAVAALRRAVTLEPDNWRHHLRLSFGSWGEERLRAARRTLSLLPDSVLPRVLKATVYVARDALAEAERELDAGLAVVANDSARPERFSTVALHWLKGLLSLARGAEDDALEHFERELALEDRGHLYARECAANSWYAIGALQMQRGDDRAAGAAFEHALQRVPAHVMAQTGLALLNGGRPRAEPAAPDPMSVDVAVRRAACLVAAGNIREAARIVASAVTAAPVDTAGWMVPVEPLLRVQHAHDAWMPVLAALRARAS